MKFDQDLYNAARRHFRAAKELYELRASGAQPGCMTVAGYLFGLSAELALKEMMRQSGMEKLDNSKRLVDPYYAHFTGLKVLLSEKVAGRRAGEISQFVDRSSFMQHWEISMRYASSSSIQQALVDKWKTDASGVLEILDY